MKPHWIGKRSLNVLLALFVALTTTIGLTAYGDADTSEFNQKFVQIEAHTKEQRSAIANLGVSIESVRTGSVWVFAKPEMLKEIRKEGFKILGEYDYKIAKGGHDTNFGGFPEKDARYHDYAEATQFLKDLHQQHADITSLISIGKSLENREIWALQINTTPDALKKGISSKPGVIFMGNHHAREHLSAEIPLLLAEHLLKNRSDSKIGGLLDTRDIWIIPMVNPDGVEYDIATGNYRMWRKNRRDNGDGTWGVDLNRNYGHMWGTGGSSKSGSSDVFMGPQPFSEPETDAIRQFVKDRVNTTVLLSFHTFSELILYPWGHKYDSVEKSDDLAVFETMAKTMTAWNGYTPQQASDLYIASGDTTDWAYGELGIFAFTFELSPKSMWSGGFYPGDIIDKVFADNLKPCMYMIEVADDPHKVVKSRPSGFLENYVQPALSENLMHQMHPLPEVAKY